MIDLRHQSIQVEPATTTPESITESLFQEKFKTLFEDRIVEYQHEVSITPAQSLILSQEMASTIFTLSKELGIDLAPPLNFDLNILPKGTTAVVMPDSTILFDLKFLEELADLISRRKPQYAKARLRGFVSHEMYHLSQKKRFPDVTAREEETVRSNPTDMNLYHLTRIEQGAPLFAIKYLKDLQETDPLQLEANKKVANEIRSKLNLDLIKARIATFFKRRT